MSVGGGKKNKKKSPRSHVFFSIPRCSDFCWSAGEKKMRLSASRVAGIAENRHIFSRYCHITRNKLTSRLKTGRFLPSLKNFDSLIVSISFFSVCVADFYHRDMMSAVKLKIKERKSIFIFFPVWQFE